MEFHLRLYCYSERAFAKNRGCVHKVMSLLKLHLFSESEIKLLKEYALVMSSLAKALEKIQGENQAYFGSLLPIVTATEIKLKKK